MTERGAMAVEVTEAEAIAVRKAWDALTPLLRFAIRKLGQEQGLQVCQGLAAGDLEIEWTQKPGLARGRISRDGETVYTFEFETPAPAFAFVDVDVQPN